jgi:hypothetical protein
MCLQKKLKNLKIKFRPKGLHKYITTEGVKSSKRKKIFSEWCINSVSCRLKDEL